MAFQVDEYGNITMIQGDSGTLEVSGLNTDKNYTVYFGVRDKNRKPVGNEIYVNTNKRDSVLFTLTPDFTDLLTVNKNETAGIYYYGLKLCDSENSLEDTLIPIGLDIGSCNTITVFPKKVEGVQS